MLISNIHSTSLKIFKFLSKNNIHLIKRRINYKINNNISQTSIKNFSSSSDQVNKKYQNLENSQLDDKEKDSTHDLSSTSSQIIKVVIDENGNRKIIYEDFNTHITNKQKTESQYVKVNKSASKVSKIKFFGSENQSAQVITDTSAEKSIENPLLDDDEEPSDPKAMRINPITNKEEVTDNLLNYEQYFSDYCRVYMKAGDGGNGMISFIKGPLFCDRTPQGGDGGKGGDIILIADENVSSLSKLRKAHFLGNSGDKGQSKSCGGKNGKDVEIRVPLGTIIYELVRNENYQYRKKELRADKECVKKQIEDMDYHGKRFVVCKGGRPGVGNVTKKNITSESKAFNGQPGEEKELELVLKCIADVGFIGYPNAGKSTLLAAVS
jgi:hypothetical protein